jgi:hypothetical protein
MIRVRPGLVRLRGVSSPDGVDHVPQDAGTPAGAAAC